MKSTITIEDMRGDGDWDNVFSYARGFSIDDIEKVIAAANGANDESSWIAIFKLKDGTFAWLTAWCDYTGWGCQEGGESHICDNLKDLMLGFVGIENCQRLGPDILG